MISILFLSSLLAPLWEAAPLRAAPSATIYSLPEIETEGGLNHLLFHRRSVRAFREGSISHQELGDLLFAALGITIDGLTGATRTAPSAGATNPLVIYGYLNAVEGFEEGLYQYHPSSHSIEPILLGDLSEELMSLALNQTSISMAQLVLLIAADFSKTTARYGDRGARYVYMEAGHSAQNALLKAQELDLKAVVIGAFYELELQKYLGLSETPLLMIPIGRP